MSEDDGEPTAAELEYEEMKSRATKLLTKQWNDTREGRVMARLEEYPHLARLYASLLAARQRFVDEHLDATMEDLNDEKEYYSNPLRYHGFSPGDFL
jgi:hypothetical protein